MDCLNVLSMTQVNRQTRDIVSHCPQQQRRLGLPPRYFRDGSVFCPSATYLWRIGGIEFTQHEDLEEDIVVTTRFLPFPGFKIPLTGPRWRSTLVCMPPIKQMEVYMSCCPGVLEPYQLEDFERKPLCSARSQNCLKLGDLYALAKQLMTDHQECESADYLTGPLPIQQLMKPQ